MRSAPTRHQVVDATGITDGIGQTLRLHHMRWRMKRVWTLVEPRLQSYDYIMWMRPDALLLSSCRPSAVGIGRDVHSLQGQEESDDDFAFWGAADGMRLLLNQYDWEYTARCNCSLTGGAAPHNDTLTTKSVR